MTVSVAVVYLARSEVGSAKDFARFAESYRRFDAGLAHDLVVIRKGAARRPGTAEAIAHLFEGVPYQAIDRDDRGYDIQAYLAVAKSLPHDFLCFLNTYSEICAADWLAKLMQPLLASSKVGMSGATASYESLHTSIGLYSKVIWMCSTQSIPYDEGVAAAFELQLAQHAPQWLALRPSSPHEASAELDLDSRALREGFARHWHTVTRTGGPLEHYIRFKPFPNPHLRSNAFVIRRELLNDMNFELDDSKQDCMRFESGLDGLPTRLEKSGFESILVGADGEGFETECWSRSRGFRLGDQSNLLVRDNQVRAFEVAGETERQHLACLTWGAPIGGEPSVFRRLGYPFEPDQLRLTHAIRNNPRPAEEALTISIVIPTRNRQSLVMDALHTVVSQPYAHWNCTIFDNCSDEPFGAAVAQLGDSRIRYVRSDVFLPVTDSWNRAIDEADGDYITLLGDDDGLTPNFMSSVDFIVRHHTQPDFIYTSMFQFFHPGVAPWEPAGQVTDLRYGEFFDDREDIARLDPAAAERAVIGSLDFRRSFAFNMQAFCFSKPFLDSLRFEGKLFYSPFPDYYLANVAMGLGKVVTIAAKPLTIAGVSRKSFGFTLFNRLETEGAALLATDLRADPLYESIRDRILPGPAYNTNYLLTMQHVKARLGSFTRGTVDVQRYRRLQILSSLLPDPESDVLTNAAVQAETLERLDPSERRWADELVALAKASHDGDAGAAARLAHWRREVSMYGKSATVRTIDVGGFAHLPALFDAMVRGDIAAATLEPS